MMSSTSVSGLQNVGSEVAELAKKVSAEIESINSKLDQLNSACSTLGGYDNQPIAGDDIIKTAQVCIGSWSDDNFQYTRFKQDEYEHIWQIEGYEEGIEIVKSVEENLKEMVDEVRTEASYAASIILDVAAGIGKNQDLANKALAEQVLFLKKIADGLKGFSTNGDNNVNIVEYRKSKEGKKIVSEAMKYVGKIPYRMGGKVGADGTIPASGLDCSGFAAYIIETTTGKNVGVGTVEMRSHCTPINKKDLKPGDLAFRFAGGDDRHVGIYVGKDKNGKNLYVHENAGANNVSVDNYAGWTEYGKVK